MKPTTLREWLEQERLTGLPHADFASEALDALDELADYENGQDDAKETVDQIAEQAREWPGKHLVDKIEWAGRKLDDLVQLMGGENAEDALANTRDMDEQYWSIWQVLDAAGLVGKDDKAADTDIAGLLRMFLPV